jgi:hypothetical protein
MQIAQRPDIHSCLVFPRLFEEAAELILSTEYYFSRRVEILDQLTDYHSRRVFTNEMHRITTRIACMLNWLSAQRAVLIGQMELTDALRQHPLDGEVLCRAKNRRAEELLPSEMGELLEYSRLLYERIYRLDRQAAANLN